MTKLWPLSQQSLYFKITRLSCQSAYSLRPHLGINEIDALKSLTDLWKTFSKQTLMRCTYWMLCVGNYSDLLFQCLSGWFSWQCLPELAVLSYKHWGYACEKLRPYTTIPVAQTSIRVNSIRAYRSLTLSPQYYLGLQASIYYIKWRINS